MCLYELCRATVLPQIILYALFFSLSSLLKEFIYFKFWPRAQRKKIL